MSDDILKKADGFRLSVDPTFDDVVEANWIIDRLSARVVWLQEQKRHVVGDKIDLRAKLATVEAQRDELLEALLGVIDTCAPECPEGVTAIETAFSAIDKAKENT